MELRPYQAQAVKALFDWFRQRPDGSGCPLVVMPTGSGKSPTMATIAKRVCEVRSGNRVLVLAHRKELIEQNADKLRRIWPQGHIGVYSAGLKEKTTRARVTFAGVQSAFRNPTALGPQTLILVDEAQLAAPTKGGMYDRFFDAMMLLNPRVRIAGLTATPYRTGTGLLTADDGIFTDVAFEAKILDLVRDGYLSPLTSKASRTETRLDGVRTVRGDYSIEDLTHLFDQDQLVKSAAEEIVREAGDRKSWLCFCVSVAHAEHLAEALRGLGVDAASVSGETPADERDRLLGRFRAGELRALCNCEILTVGFDHPEIDLIACLRATKSVGLWVQMLGRGLRIAHGKKDCMVLDFTDNSQRIGPIDRIEIARKRNQLTEEDELVVETEPGKTCPACRLVVPSKCRECPECGHVFPVAHQREASAEPVMSNINLPAGYFEGTVAGVEYALHTKAETGSKSVKVTVHLGISGGSRQKSFCFWKGFDGTGRSYAERWWRQWHPDGVQAAVPKTTVEAVSRTKELREPHEIVYKRREGTDPTKPFWEVEAVKSWRQPEGIEVGELNI